MRLPHTLADHGRPLEARDAELFARAAGRDVERFLTLRGAREETPLVSLRGLADEIGVASVHIKDEGQRRGLGSFKALGGAYAVIRFVLEDIPTHVFLQAEVGGIAAAASGSRAERYGDRRPCFVVVEPARAACLHTGARVGAPAERVGASDPAEGAQT